MNLRYKRILLKLSGEVLRDATSGDAISPKILSQMTERVLAATSLGCEVAIVLGGGNIFRGISGIEGGIERCTGDYMGMLATVINALALQNSLEQRGAACRVMTAVEMPKVAEPYLVRKARRHLEKGRITILAGGTGNPFFSTDTAAALRASEIGADVLLKATKVDGIYTADPKKDPTAKRFDKISYAEALAKKLKVMDATAFALCMENKLPIVVCDFFDADALPRLLQGENVGTLVTTD